MTKVLQKTSDILKPNLIKILITFTFYFPLFGDENLNANAFYYILTLGCIHYVLSCFLLIAVKKMTEAETKNKKMLIVQLFLKLVSLLYVLGIAGYLFFSYEAYHFPAT